MMISLDQIFFRSRGHEMIRACCCQLICITRYIHTGQKTNDNSAKVTVTLDIKATNCLKGNSY